MKVLLIGGSGLLGTELKKIYGGFIAPSHNELEIANFEDISKYSLDVDIIVNLAAVKKEWMIGEDPITAINTNIIGSANLAKKAQSIGARYVFVSTDYVYSGLVGAYVEDSHLSPANKYAWTKLAGEASARLVDNHLIIRTSFCDNKEFPYKEAYIDRYTSKDYVNVIAPKIINAIFSNLTGTINIGTKKKSIFELARRGKFDDVIGVRAPEGSPIPRDVSFDTSKYDSYERKFKYVEDCRCCGSSNLKKYLNLGMMPMANNLEETKESSIGAERFPLEVLLCEDCGLSQLSIVIDPNVLFSYYTYRSSVNKGYVKHARKLAESLQLKGNEFVIDIAGNDGALLREFQSVYPGVKVLNVDPAENLAKIAIESGVSTLNQFWGEKTATDFIKQKADIIIATNVFAHVDDVRDFLRGIKIALSDNGKFIMEFPWVLKFLEKNEFDTIYFEHLSYIAISPLARLCKEVGLVIQNIEFQSIHGGTARVTIGHNATKESDEILNSYLLQENMDALGEIQTYLRFGKIAKQIANDLRRTVRSLISSGYSIAAFGASAKGNTLLNYAKLDHSDIMYIADETPEKIGKYSPGTGIKIVTISELEINPPDYLLITPWNFSEEIIAKVSPYYKGKFIIPIPEVEII